MIVAFQYRRYYKFKGNFDENHVTGMCFFLSNGSQVVNYPNLHCQNLTVKHQATNGKFKPMIRIFKNLRTKMIEDGLIAKGSAPSYYIEGLLYNVPNGQFVGDYQNITLNILKWVYDCQDRTELVCANEQYYLLRDNAETCWTCAADANFINAATQVWNDW